MTFSGWEVKKRVAAGEVSRETSRESTQEDNRRECEGEMGDVEFW